MKLIFLKPKFMEKIWGGNLLKTEFGMDIPSENTGEAWIISGHYNAVSEISYPKEYEGIGLDKLYKENRALFGNEDGGEEIEDFPLLIKILDANDKLSVQVHPDDDYAKANIGPRELGKNECWYILDAVKGAEIVYGHNAKSKEEFREMIESGDYNHLLKKIKVKKGDFFSVPSGTVHAIGSGILILETQQSSDTTYRVYDYDRIDDEGNKRDLHIEESIAVSTIPHRDVEFEQTVEIYDGADITNLLSNKYFTVRKIDVNSKFKYNPSEKYLLMTVIEGSGEITLDKEKHSLNKGDSFIVPYGNKMLYLEGNITIIESSVNN